MEKTFKLIVFCGFCWLVPEFVYTQTNCAKKMLISPTENKQIVSKDSTAIQNKSSLNYAKRINNTLPEKNNADSSNLKLSNERYLKKIPLQKPEEEKQIPPSK